jgi:enoyl-[acyl-carrier protein] reductase II
MMRVIRTDAAEAIDASGEATTLGGGGLERIRELYFDGEMTAGVANTGQVAGRIADIRPAAEIIAEMWAGCSDVIAAAALRFK